MAAESAYHWVVRLNYRNRAVAFVVLGAMLIVHGLDQRLGTPLWVLLALNFFVMPHLAYLQARRAADPVRAEVRQTLVDSASFGFWSGMLGLPDWLVFIFLVGGLLNPTAFRGRRGLAQGAAAYALALCVGWGLAGFVYRPETSPTVTLLAVAALLYYLITFGLATYQRSVNLHRAREAVRNRELELKAQLEEISRLQDQLREQALRDPLTSLYNRRYFEPTLARELSRCLRDEEPLSVIMVDIDHFKAVNDRYGHPAGDYVLRQLAQTLVQGIRGADVVARLGGEEFALILPGIDAAAAVERAEMLRVSWMGAALSFEGQPVASTISLGLVTAPADGLDADELLRHADAALYGAKREGRNRVQQYGSKEELERSDREH